MAYTEAELRTRITALEDALAGGTDTVQYADRMVRYKSNTAIEQALAYFQRLLSSSEGLRTRSKQWLGVGDKGL